MGHLRLTTAGESHGPAEVCILDGIPAGLHVSTADIDADLARRHKGMAAAGAWPSRATERVSFPVSGWD